MDGRRLCRGCVTGLEKDLFAVIELYQDLEGVAVSRGGGGRERVGGTVEKGLRYDQRAIEHMEQIRFDLWSMLKPEVSHGDAISVMVHMALWRMREWTAGKDAAAIRETWRDNVRAAWRIIQPEIRRVFVGECNVEGCGGEIAAEIHKDVSLSRLRCESCGLDVPVRDWAKWGVRNGFLSD